MWILDGLMELLLISKHTFGKKIESYVEYDIFNVD